MDSLETTLENFAKASLLLGLFYVGLTFVETSVLQDERVKVLQDKEIIANREYNAKLSFHNFGIYTLYSLVSMGTVLHLRKKNSTFIHPMDDERKRDDEEDS